MAEVDGVRALRLSVEHLPLAEKLADAWIRHWACPDRNTVEEYVRARTALVEAVYPEYADKKTLSSLAARIRAHYRYHMAWLKGEQSCPAFSENLTPPENH